jgi:nuclear transport factor 2 (NTF2) superfamily protein
MQMPDKTMPQSEPLSHDTVTNWGDRCVTGWNSREPERLASLVTDDVTWTDPFIYPNGVLHGTVELRRWLRSL